MKVCEKPIRKKCPRSRKAKGTFLNRCSTFYTVAQNISLEAAYCGTHLLYRRYVRGSPGAMCKTNMKEQASARCVSTGATTQDDNSLRAMKARQTRKIEQLREVLFANRHLRVREQAELLGLGRSTAHAVLQRSYKHSGLSAAIIKRMLACRTYPTERGLSLSNTTPRRLPDCTGIHVPKDLDLWLRSQWNRTVPPRWGKSVASF